MYVRRRERFTVSKPAIDVSLLFPTGTGTLGSLNLQSLKSSSTFTKTTELRLYQSRYPQGICPRTFKEISTTFLLMYVTNSLWLQFVVCVPFLTRKVIGEGEVVNTFLFPFKLFLFFFEIRILAV